MTGVIISSPFAWAPGELLDEEASWNKAIATLDAIRLIQLGARASLVRELTGIDKKKPRTGCIAGSTAAPPHPDRRPLPMPGS